MVVPKMPHPSVAHYLDLCLPSIGKKFLRLKVGHGVAQTGQYLAKHACATLLTRVCPFVRLQVRALGINFVAAHHVTPVNFAPSQTVAIVGCGAGGSGPTAHTVLRSNPITGIHYRRFVEDPETLGETPHFMKLIDARTIKILQIYTVSCPVQVEFSLLSRLFACTL
jgi:hypothetical protein